MSLLASHLPFFVPAQGPLSIPLVHLVIGQIPAVSSNRQSPQAAHRSSQTPDSLVMPMKEVLTPGSTGSTGKCSAIACTPIPQPRDRITSEPTTFSGSSSRNSGSHCLFIVYSEKMG